MTSSRARTQSGKKAALGEQLQDRVGRYHQLAIEHPTWRPKEFASYFSISYSEARRLGVYAAAPDEIQQALFAGALSGQAAEAILDSPGAKHPYIREIDKINVARKVVAGLAPRGAEALRAVMEVLSDAGRVGFVLRDRWLDPDEAMSYDDLWLAIHDLSADRAAAAKAAQLRDEQSRLSTMAFDQLLRGSTFLKWIPKVEFDLVVLESHLPEIIASARYRRLSDDISIADRLRELAAKFISAAERADELEHAADTRAAGETESPPTPSLHVVPAIVLADADGAEVVHGVVL